MTTDAKELLARLRDESTRYFSGSVTADAADLIEAQETERDELRDRVEVAKALCRGHIVATFTGDRGTRGVFASRILAALTEDPIPSETED